MNTLVKGIFCLPGLVAGLWAANPLGLPAETHHRLLAAMEANFRMDFAAGARELAAIEHEAAAHPLVGFGHLLMQWWVVTAAVWEEDAERCAPMLAAADRCLADAERLIEQGDPSGEGHLVKGATLGLLGRWHIKNRHWVKSYFVGKEAKANLTRAIEINPDLFDAYAGIGIYDYFVAKLPQVIRWLAFRGQTADTAAGMRMLEQALTRGTYTVVGTKAVLTLVQLRHELNPARGRQLADELVEQFPRSPFGGSLKMIALYDANQPEALAAEAARQAELLAAGGYPPDRAGQVHFAAGLAHFRVRAWSEAARDYRAAVEQGSPADPFVTWARLHLGNIHDVTGDRRAARTIYREVRGELNRWGTKRLAGRYLKKAFDPDVHQVRMLPD